VVGTQSVPLARTRAALKGRIVVLALESVWALTHSEPSVATVDRAWAGIRSVDLFATKDPRW
jgi:hypothetical protein